MIRLFCPEPASHRIAVVLYLTEISDRAAELMAAEAKGGAGAGAGAAGAAGAKEEVDADADDAGASGAAPAAAALCAPGSPAGSEEGEDAPVVALLPDAE